MWNLPEPELEPVSPALAGGFLTTAPPGKSQEGYLNEGDLRRTPEATPLELRPK